MKKSLKGSKTERNLLTAFAGESQARNRYDYFSSLAKSEGFVQISAIFAETANQEKEHAKRMFKFLEGGELAINAVSFPAGMYGAPTIDNLLASAAGENHEYTHMYPEYADIAKVEGFLEVFATFRAIMCAEEFHEKRFLALAENIKNNRVFARDSEQVWRCRNCGYIHVGETAPELCPACIHPKAHFELCAKNW